MKKIGNSLKWLSKIVIATLICIFAPCPLCIFYNNYIVNFIVVCFVVIMVIAKKTTDEENY